MKDNQKKQKRNYKPRVSIGGEELTHSEKLAHEAIQAEPLQVKVYGNNFEKALRAFRALVQKERILSIFKEKQTYEKPSNKKRRKRNESKRKQLELLMKRERNTST
jgi:small subunit ribosomal protein S21